MIAASTGVLIAVSGMDGTGKTTFIASLQALLAEVAGPVLVSKQPSQLISTWPTFRSAVSDRDDPPFDARLVPGLVAWDRLATQIQTVQPQLRAGRIVVLERYALDIIAFGRSRGAPEPWISAWVAPLIAPDIEIVLDADARVVDQRLGARGSERKALERSVAAIESVLDAFRRAAKERGAIVVDSTVDASDTRRLVAASAERLWRSRNSAPAR